MQVVPIRVQATRRLGTRGGTLIVALAAGLAAALLAFLLVRGRLASASAVLPVPVVVAVRDIPARSRLAAGMLGVRRLAPSDVPEGAAASSKALLGKVTTQTVLAGSAVTTDVVTAPSAALGMAFALPPSLRAVTVATDQGHSVFVDILLK